MTIQDKGTALALLKADLGYFGQPLPSDLNDYLVSILDTAEEELRRFNNIILAEGCLADMKLAAEYASWVYRKRATGEGKSRMLRDDIRAHQRFPSEVNG